MGGLGVFLGLPDRHNENTCWLVHFYDDFVLVLGGSWGLLGASWAVLGASWGLLGASWRPLGELLCAFVIEERVQDARCCIMCHVLKKCLFLKREHEIQQPQASWRLLVCLLGRLGSLLEAFGSFLEHLRGILMVSWRPCWSLGRPKGENVDFSLVL